MQHIYIFSGLGADQRVFQLIDFLDFEVTFIEWITPNRNERIEEYAFRLTKQIKNHNPILIGLSFGGIIATEVAKWIPTQKIILIASAQTKKNIPFYYRIVGYLGLHQLLPVFLLKQSNFFSHWFFDLKTKKDKELLTAILKHTTNVFLKWAIHQIVTWKNTTKPKNTIQIHGTKDRILPIFFADVDVKVVGGGHFMTVNKAEELTRLLRKEIINSFS